VSLKPPPSVKHAAASSPNHRLAVARHAEERELKAEGEAAKEQLMLALSIASTALNDAQKAVHDDGLNP
jgi:signal transduction histidine kinase